LDIAHILSAGWTCGVVVVVVHQQHRVHVVFAAMFVVRPYKPFVLVGVSPWHCILEGGCFTILRKLIVTIEN